MSIAITGDAGVEQITPRIETYDPSASFRNSLRCTHSVSSIFSLLSHVARGRLGVALIFNVVWIGFHGFELFKLIF